MPGISVGLAASTQGTSVRICTRCCPQPLGCWFHKSQGMGEGIGKISDRGGMGPAGADCSPAETRPLSGVCSPGLWRRRWNSAASLRFAGSFSLFRFDFYV